MCEINETRGTIPFVDRSATESQTNELTDSLHFVRVLLAVIYAILFALGLSNVLITLFIILRKVFTTVTNILILNLSLADTVFIMFLPFVISFRIKRTWIFGTAICKLFFISESTTKYASVYFISLLSIDRCLSVRFQNYRVSRCKRMLAVVAALVGWTVISSLMVPIYIYSEIREVTPNTVVCTIAWPADSFHDQFGQTRTSYTTEHYFTLYSFVLCFLIPSIIMIFCYYLLVRQVIMSGRRLKKNRTKCMRNSYGRLKRMVISIVCCYLLCWTPYWIMNLIVVFNANVQVTTSLRIMFNVIHILPYVSCVTNPLLYALFTSHFKEVVRKAARGSSLVQLTHLKSIGRFHIR
ncbi:Somatostatin receptor type 1 [Trichuris trichiura]|uniref:Somatostatin receptor type 1 n=1 Tax=Trichuris trichiura TaxID=36087 RepID=A0A077YWL6_TRITR|nr:Somatostatin receptor type 1 [Trichuris trichiura]